MKTTTTLAALLILLSVGQPTADADVVTVALSGDTAPGTSNSFSNFSTPILNDVGQTAFVGRLTGSSVTDRGIWSEGSGSGLALIAREGNLAPGTIDNFASFSSNLVFNNAGQTAFLGALNGGIGIRGIWSEGGGSGLALIAREGNLAPGTSDNFANFPARPVLNDAGQTAFIGFLGGSFAANSSIWSEGGGSGLALIAREGNPAPGTIDNFVSFDISTPALNNAGQTAFSGRLTGSSVTDRGIWSEGGGNGLALVTRSGNLAPGTSDNFASFANRPVLNDAGQTAFSGNLTGNIATNSGIWSEGGGSGLALVARKGNMAPGTSDNFNFLNRPVLNDAGQTAFFGRLNNSSSATDRGIWSEGDGSGLALVAREGNPAPGTNRNFASFGNTLVLNDAGQTAFFGRLVGADNGIWATNLSGVLTLIVREGDLLDVDDGPGTDFRTINRIVGFFSDTGNGDGRPSGFNNLGQLVFSALFTDGTRGVFISNLVAIPEPSTLLLGVMASMGLLMRRRRVRSGQ